MQIAEALAIDVKRRMRFNCVASLAGVVICTTRFWKVTIPLMNLYTSILLLAHASLSNCLRLEASHKLVVCVCVCVCVWGVCI